jgi:hypothetical protein
VVVQSYPRRRMSPEVFGLFGPEWLGINSVRRPCVEPGVSELRAYGRLETYVALFNADSRTAPQEQTVSYHHGIYPSLLMKA